MHIVLAEIVDDCSFDDAGNVVPRPGAVPKSTAGSTEDTVASLDEHEGNKSARFRGIKKREDHADWRATGVGVNIMPIGRKHRRLWVVLIRWRRRTSAT